MSVPQPPLSSDARHFCRQMLLAMEAQMDGEKSKSHRDRQVHSDRYLDLLKDLCDVYAKGFEMTRCDVLERLGNFANPSEIMFNDFCRFPSTPPHESPLSVTSRTQVVDLGMWPNFVLSVPTPRGRSAPNSQVQAQQKFQYLEYRENFSTTHRQRKRPRFHLGQCILNESRFQLFSIDQELQMRFAMMMFAIVVLAHQAWLTRLRSSLSNDSQGHP